MDANFVGVETSYGKCKALLSSKSRLHKHLNNSCITSIQHSLPDAPSPTSPIPIITLESVVPAMGSSLAFRGWTYATAAVTLVSRVLPLESDPSTTACLDTGCGVILIDKDWLLWQLPDQKIKEMSTLLIVRGIEASRYKFAQFAELSFFFPGEDNER